MTSQSSTGSTGEHVVDRLAEYFGGSLAADDELAVETHLLSCAECQAEYNDLGEVALALAFGPPALLGEAAPAAPHVPATRQPSSRGSRGSTGPGRDTSPGPAGRSRPTMRRLAGYAAALVAGAALGVGAMAVVNQFDTPPLQTVGDNRDISTDRLSVTLVEAAGGTQVRAAAVGVPPGHGFQVVAVGTDGQGYLVTTGVADGGLLSVVGTVPISASEIVFVALVEDGDGAILVARPS